MYKLCQTFTFPDDEEVEHQQSDTLPAVAEEAEVDPVPQTAAEADAVSDEAEASPDKKADAKKPEVTKKVQQDVASEIGKIFCCLITLKSVDEYIYGR